jgi:TolB-like protein
MEKGQNMPNPRMSLIYMLATSVWLFAQQSDKISLAVSDLTAQGVKESDAAVISEQLRAELMKSPRIQLIERNQMQEILKEQGFQQSGCTSDACAVEIGQLLGVKNMVVGSVGAAGSYTVLSVRVVDVSTGTVVANESLRSKGGIDKVLESGIKDAAGKLILDLFPQAAQPGTEPAPKGKPKTGRAFLIGGGAAVLVGGGITAAVLLSRHNAPSSSGTPNTRIDLP